MFRASSAHLQEDTVVYMQHMVLSLSTRVPGGTQLEFSLKQCTDKPPRIVTVPNAACVQLYPPEDEHLRLETFIHSVICLTTGPKPPPKRCLHIVRSRASAFKWEYPLLSLRSSNSFLRLLPRHLVTSISPFIFPSIICFGRQLHCTTRVTTHTCYMYCCHNAEVNRRDFKFSVLNFKNS